MTNVFIEEPNHAQLYPQNDDEMNKHLLKAVSYQTYDLHKCSIYCLYCTASVLVKWTQSYRVLLIYILGRALQQSLDWISVAASPPCGNVAVQLACVIRLAGSALFRFPPLASLWLVGVWLRWDAWVATVWGLLGPLNSSTFFGSFGSRSHFSTSSWPPTERTYNRGKQWSL